MIVALVWAAPSRPPRAARSSSTIRCCASTILCRIEHDATGGPTVPKVRTHCCRKAPMSPLSFLTSFPWSHTKPPGCAEAGSGPRPSSSSIGSPSARKLHSFPTLTHRRQGTVTPSHRCLRCRHWAQARSVLLEPVLSPGAAGPACCGVGEVDERRRRTRDPESG
jgi:hypothetical protein